MATLRGRLGSFANTVGSRRGAGFLGASLSADVPLVHRIEHTFFFVKRRRGEFSASTRFASLRGKGVEWSGIASSGSGQDLGSLGQRPYQSKGSGLRLTTTFLT